jgi:hypothetical protein
MLPQVRLQPWFPGQFGVPGSDVQRGLRWEPTGIVLYVDPDSNNDSDAADGTDPENPMTTIQAAVNKLIAHQTAMGCSLSGSVIVLGGMAYTEAVTIPATAPTYCTIVGARPSRFRPTWASDAAASPCLTVRAEGWTIRGIEFDCPASSSGIKLEEVTATHTAYKTAIEDCTFDGLFSGRYGIEFYGAPHRVRIANNWFIEMHQGDNSAFCLCVTNSAVGPGNPYQCEIVGNRFIDSDNYVGSLGSARAWNVSLFQGNVFEEGLIVIPALYLDLRGGSRGYNIVTGNFFGGTYSNAGGYYANALTPNSCWVGNIAEPTPATVADNGFTVQVPI